MIAIVCALLLLAGASQAQPTTPPTCPADNRPCDTKDHVCTSNGCCGLDAPCACKAPGAGPLQYSCNTAGTVCPAGQTASAQCGVVTKGDPLVRGFDGCAWYLKGKPDTVMNLVSEANHVVNTYLVAANLTDEHHGGEGTFHGAISVRYQNTLITSRVTPMGNLTVEVAGAVIPFDTVRERSGVTVKVAQHYPYYGQVAEIVTPAFRFFLHAVQPYDTPAGWSRGHLDFTATANTDTVMHGLLGQSISHSSTLCSDDFDFHGQGKEEEYTMSDLASTDYPYSMFATQKLSRRLHSDAPVYIPAVTPRMATVGRF